jgi:ABC-type oligopeptide transport system ATPase subunit
MTRERELIKIQQIHDYKQSLKSKVSFMKQKNKGAKENSKLFTAKRGRKDRSRDWYLETRGRAADTGCRSVRVRLRLFRSSLSQT